MYWRGNLCNSVPEDTVIEFCSVFVNLGVSAGYYSSCFRSDLESTTVLVPFAFPAGFGSIISGLFLSLPLSESSVTPHHLTNDISTDKEYKENVRSRTTGINAICKCQRQNKIPHPDPS